MSSAQINFVRIDHNLFVGPEIGMVIHVGFDVQGMAGQPGQVAGYFNYWQGGPLRDFDQQFKSDAGHVAVAVDFTPGFDTTNYPDFQLFMPYRQLEMGPGVAHLMCRVQVWDMSHVVPQTLATSTWIYFYYSPVVA